MPDYFLGLAKPEDVLMQTSFPNLIIAGALTPADNASELLAGPRFSELLAHIRLRSPNACVLVDLPPVNVTDEALLVGPRVDAFLIVVSEGKTERKQSRAGAQHAERIHDRRRRRQQVQRQPHLRVHVFPVLGLVRFQTAGVTVICLTARCELCRC